MFLAVYTHAAAGAGETARAEGMLTQLRRRYGTGEASSYDLGLALTGLGRHDEGLDWLERAFEARAGLLVFLGVEPLYDAVRAHPRFVRLLERLGLIAP